MFSKYKYVHMLYQEKSFTKAAEKLYISQPSLSAAIKGIEKELGAPIFQRTGAGVVPTDVGQVYVDAVEEIVRIERDCMRKINDIGNLVTGSLVVGGSNYLSSYVFPRVINIFTSRYPGVHVDIQEANATAMEEMLEQDQVDLVIDSFDTDAGRYHYRPLTRERILLCVPADREINRKFREAAVRPDDIYYGMVDLDSVPAVSIKEFAEEPFVILKKGNDMHARAAEIFGTAGVDPQVRFRVDQMTIAYAMTELGTGLCFATDTLFRYGRFPDRDVSLYQLKEDTRSRTLCVAYRKNKYCTRAMEKFTEVAREFLG